MGWRRRLGETCVLGTWDPTRTDEPTSSARRPQGSPRPLAQRDASRSNRRLLGPVVSVPFTSGAAGARCVYRFYILPLVEAATWMEYVACTAGHGPGLDEALPVRSSRRRPYSLDALAQPR